MGAPKPAGRGAEGELGINAQPPGHVDERKQRVTEPALRGVANLTFRKAILGRFAPEIGRHGPPLDLARVEEGRQVLRDIGERLSLSQHTIARHLANARAKLGAANRTEAAMKLEELDGSSPKLS